MRYNRVSCTYTIAAASDPLRNPAPVHDDVQDGDTERRAVPALWVHDGIGAPVCAGDLMISGAPVVLAGGMKGAQLRRAPSMTHAAQAETIAGQDADLTAAPNSPLADTVAISAGKSGPLIARPVRVPLLAARATGDIAARVAARALAVGSQILNDHRILSEDRRAGRLNAVLALERVGRFAIHAGDCARTQIDTADTTARSIPQDAGLPLATLSARIQLQLTEIANAP